MFKFKPIKKRIFIIHGWEGKPDSNWFPWLKQELEKKGLEVFIPQMPHADKPIMSEWLLHLQEIIGEPDENTFLVGHSLGVIAILRYLESLPADKKIGGAVLVAGFPEPIAYEELNSFFTAPLDYEAIASCLSAEEKVKSGAGKIVAINSDNDPYVPLEQGEIMRDKLGAKLIVVSNAGHLNAEDGFTKLPVVLDEILRIVG